MQDLNFSNKYAANLHPGLVAAEALLTRQRQKPRENFLGKGRERRRGRDKAVWCRGEAEIKARQAKAPKTNHYYHYYFASMPKWLKSNTLALFWQC